MARLPVAALALAIVPSIGAAQALSAVHGRILDEGGAALVGVEIAIPAAHRTARSDSAGRFQLDSLTAGKHLLQVRGIGYQPRIVLAAVFGRDTASFELRLARSTPTLDTVNVRAPRPLFQAYDDFETRRRVTSGRFLTFEYLEAQAGRKLGDILATAGTGVHMLHGAHGIGPRIAVVQRDMFGGNCPMQVFLDYQRIRSTEFDIDDLDPRDIGGIEVYRGPAETPETFHGDGEKCGTLVIWTRMR